MFLKSRLKTLNKTLAIMFGGSRHEGLGVGGERVSPSHWGRVLGGVLSPPRRNFLNLTAFNCIYTVSKSSPFWFVNNN